MQGPAAQALLPIVDAPTSQEVRDLLGAGLGPQQDASRRIAIREAPDGSMVVAGATEHPVSGYDSIMRLLDAAVVARTTGATLMNDRSSRSHAIFTLHVDQARRKAEATSCRPLPGRAGPRLALESSVELPRVRPASTGPGSCPRQERAGGGWQRGPKDGQAAPGGPGGFRAEQEDGGAGDQVQGVGCHQPGKREAWRWVQDPEELHRPGLA